MEDQRSKIRSGGAPTITIGGSPNTSPTHGRKQFAPDKDNGGNPSQDQEESDVLAHGLNHYQFLCRLEEMVDGLASTLDNLATDMERSGSDSREDSQSGGEAQLPVPDGTPVLSRSLSMNVSQEDRRSIMKNVFKEKVRKVSRSLASVHMMDHHLSRAIKRDFDVASSKADANKRERKMSIFVSSTFLDFAEERELLQSQVFPQVQSVASQRGVSFSVVDMRWGITNEMGADGLTVLTCLEAVDNCRPYFVAMMGQRYGWCIKGQQGSSSDERSIGSSDDEQENNNDSLLDRSLDIATATYPWISHYRDRSVTELEITHGVLNHPKLLESKKGTPCACFCLRDQSYLDNVPPNKRNAFEDKDPDIRRRITDLKTRILQTKSVIHHYNFPVEIVGNVSKYLFELLDSDFPLLSSPDEIVKEKIAHDAFAEARTKLYIGESRKYFVDRLTMHVSGAGKPLVIVGDTGCGKSALIANWLRQYRDHHPEAFVCAHYIGATPMSTTSSNLLRRVMGELLNRFGSMVSKQQPLPGNNTDITNDFMLWLSRAGDACSTVVLAFDGVDQISDHSFSQSEEDTSPNLFSSASGDGNNVLAQRSPTIGSLGIPNSATDVTTVGGGAAAKESMAWLPATFPPHARVVLSCSSLSPCLDALVARGFSCISVSLLSDTERKELCVKYLRLVRKELDIKQIDHIMSCKQGSNPLYLRTLLQELCIVGIYNQLDVQIQKYLQAKNLTELFEMLLCRWERDYTSKQPLSLYGIDIANNSRTSPVGCRPHRSNTPPPLKRSNSMPGRNGVRSQSQILSAMKLPSSTDLDANGDDTNPNQDKRARVQSVGSKNIEKPSVVQNVMMLIWVSRKGLSQYELQQILAIPSTTMSTFLQASGDALSSRGGYLNFGHDFVRKAVVRRYVRFGQKALDYRRMLAAYFASCHADTSPRKMEEFPYLLLPTSFSDGDLNALSHYIGTLEVFEQFYNNERYELLRFWKAIDEHFDAACRVYLQALQDGENVTAELSGLVGDFLIKIGKYKEADTAYMYALHMLEGAKNGVKKGDSRHRVKVPSGEDEKDPSTVTVAATIPEMSATFQKRKTGRSDDKKEQSKETHDQHERDGSHDTAGSLPHVLATLRVRRRIGLAKYKQEAFTVAASWYKEALEIGAQEMKKNPPTLVREGLLKEIALTERFLANVLNAIKNYDDALVLFESALKTMEEFEFGADIPNVLLGAGNAYAGKGETRRAVDMFSRCLGMQERSLGPIHPNVAKTLLGLAECHLESGDIREADTMYRRALHIQMSTLGRKHPNCLKSLIRILRKYHAYGHREMNERYMPELCSMVDDEQRRKQILQEFKRASRLPSSKVSLAATATLVAASVGFKMLLKR